MPRSPRTAKQPGYLRQSQIKSTCIHPNLGCWSDPLLSQGHPVMFCYVLGWSSVVSGVILSYPEVILCCPRVTLWCSVMSGVILCCPGVILSYSEVIPCCLRGHSQLFWGDPLLSWDDPLLSQGHSVMSCDVLGWFSVVSGIILCCPGVILSYPEVILCCPGVILCCPGVILCCPGVILCCPGVMGLTRNHIVLMVSKYFFNNLYISMLLYKSILL